MHISSLYIYPIKSTAGRAVESSAVSNLGLEGDRRWMIVDPSGKFVTQREFQPLTQLHANPTPTGLTLTIGDDHLDVPFPGSDERIDVTVWKSQVNAAACGPAVQEFFMRHFNRPFSLVYQDDKADRAVEEGWAPAETQVSFADGYPVLIILQSSLDALNDALVAQGKPAVPITRFRPNIVIEDAPAWADDSWQTIRIGDIEFDLVKPCTRCIMTTNDPETGERADNEPLMTLSKLRRSGDPRVRGVLFGWNVVPRSDGHLKVGDSVSVLRENPAPFPIMPPKDK